MYTYIYMYIYIYIYIYTHTHTHTHTHTWYTCVYIHTHSISCIYILYLVFGHAYTGGEEEGEIALPRGVAGFGRLVEVAKRLVKITLHTQPVLVHFP